ncbi:MAG: acetyl-CoA carboxylase biotin carboxylase subunit [Rhizobiaceae bacterium]
MTGTIDSLLVANRGEIACRIMRTASAMGIRTIAVHSEADAAAPHVAIADEAVPIGPAPVAESYMDIGRIIEAARATGAAAVHPGYGFLSENAAFAEACATAGLIFIGPPADAIALMGNKAEAKRLMISAGVPCVPGYEGEDQSDGALTEAAEKIGFPLMVKATAGGGGRGMRLVADAASLPEALNLARSEAENAFGSGDLILERAIVRPRHVEIQVFADSHGNVIHLGERDCSVQRRHQKVIEEAPSPAVGAALRAKMGAAAVEAARTIGYVGAGTVEFLLDPAGEFYFLEMNTRLQVEHPVTEMVTGLDLVALQIAVARGEPLDITQADVKLDGHAIEVRLYAEDPDIGFLPSTGDIVLWQPPEGPDVRVDAGIASGQAVSPHYDPMLAKIIARGDTRDEARRRLIGALGRTALFGPATNRDFLLAALLNDKLAAGEATTAFIEEAFGGREYAPAPSFDNAAIAAVLRYLWARDRSMARAGRISGALLDWSSRGPIPSHFRLAAGETDFALAVTAEEGGYRVSGAGHSVFVRPGRMEGNRARFAIGLRTVDVIHHADAAGVWLATRDRTTEFRAGDAGPGGGDDTVAGGAVLAPMHGRIVELFVAAGDEVVPGDRLAVLEAMKMQHQIVARLAGKVTAVHAAAGTQVGADDLLVEIEVADA